MKIALVMDALRRGGSERQVLLAARELGRIGHEAEVVIYHPQVDYCEFIAKHHVKVVEAGARRYGRAGRVLWLAGYIRSQGFDVIHGFGVHAATTAAVSARLVGHHAVIGGCRVEYRDRLLSRVHRGIDHWLCAWVTNTEAIARSLVSALGIRREKIFVVYNGIEPDAFVSPLTREEAKQRLGVSPQHRIVTIVARLYPQKNHRMFLDMATHILSRHAGITFLIVGDGVLLQEMKQYARRSGIADSVRFLGRREDVADILAATDASVLTSDYEGFPNVLIESMAAGIPVVSTDYWGVEELVQHERTGLISPRGEARLFADQVLRLLRDRDLSSRLSQAARRMVTENLTPRRMAERLESVYRRFSTDPSTGIDCTMPMPGSESR